MDGGTSPGWRDGLREAWRLAVPFWRSQPRAGGQLAVLVALTLAIVWVNVRFSAWNHSFYDALQARDLGGFWRQLGVFGALAAAYIGLAVVRLVTQQRLVIRWREALTEQLLAQWLRPGTPYRSAGAVPRAAPDNPDQRLAEDVRAFASTTLDLALGLLNAGVTLLSFVFILWSLSGSVHVPWPAPGWQLPGYMLWVAVAYAAVGSWLVRRLGAPLVPANARQQRVEADFRYGLVQVRDHAEAIALARGENAEHRRLRGRFEAVRANWLQLVRYNKRLTLFSAAYGQLANVFPLLAAAPRYFAGQIQLGGLMQTAQAFGQVQGALSWFVDAYGSLADWRATVLRLSTFEAALRADRAPLDPASATGLAAVHPAPAAALVVHRLAVQPPGAVEPLALPDLQVQPAEWVLLSGPSGSGKSSLLRALAGLWPAQSGWLRVPAPPMVVPQRPYLANASLAELLAYPLAPEQFGVVAMRLALKLSELAPLVDRLGQADAWANRLSPGEQQKLQFARLFLHRPRWILLDEATSALDSPTQARLLGRLRALLPHAAVLHAGHRPELRALHDREVRVGAPTASRRHDDVPTVLR